VYVQNDIVLTCFILCNLCPQHAWTM